ncbi:MAG: MFS transporter [Chloroflexi bacterium]|nr:MFS transporter [Chloroflexota bacterium]
MAGEGLPWLRLAWRYSIASLGAGFFYGFSNGTLPLIVSAYTRNPLIIGLVSSSRSIEGVAVQPLVGAWSDRIWTRFGRRRPFMTVGIILAAVFFGVAALAQQLSLLLLSIFLFSLFFNVAVDPLNALLGDLFPVAQRSMVNALATVVQFAGMVAVLISGAQLLGRKLTPLLFLLIGGGMLVTFAVTIVTVPEQHNRSAHAPPRTGVERGRQSPLALLARHEMALRYLVCDFCYNFGSNAILPYLTLFATKVIRTDAANAQYLFLGLVVSTAVLLLPAGGVAARTGRKRVLAGGIAVMAVAALGGLLIQTVLQTLVVIIVAGAGNAAITAASWPLLTELIPAEEVGVFAGLKTAFESVAIPASVLFSSVLITRWGYRAIFVVLVLGAAAALAVLWTVHIPAGSDPVAAQGSEQPPEVLK